MAKKKATRKVASKKKTITTKRSMNLKDDLPKISTHKGLPSAGVTTRKLNKREAMIASGNESKLKPGLPGLVRNAALMMDSNIGGSHGYWGQDSLSAYYSSYVDGRGGGTSYYDIPTYFTLLNEQNGGVLYWPATLRERYEWFRYFARTDAYCGRALELMTDLPMSKISLHMPQMDDKEKRTEILRFFKAQIEHINLFDHLQSVLWETNVIGNVFIFHEWCDKMKWWDNILILPPEEVSIFHMPFSGNRQDARVEYRPPYLIKILEKAKDDFHVGSEVPEGFDDLENEIIKSVPDELKKMIEDNGRIFLDTDPMTGSFVHHIARRKAKYHDLGASVLERVLVPLLTKEHYRYTQLSLASRNMTPKNKITAPGLTDPELDDLRLQVDMSYMSPDYSIVTNYEFEWELIGAESRLLDLSQEYEIIENHIFAGLGVTRELLTGEGSYSGNRITIEILNTMFMLTRQIMQNYIEQQLFKPIAEAHGWYEEDKNGIKDYFYPKVGFNRLSIRDNQEIFDSLFQLYQKGSLPIDILYELFNLNTDEIHEKIYEQLGTVKDPTFNEVMTGLNSEVGRNLAEFTNAVEKAAEYLGLEMKEQVPEDEGGFGGGGFDGDDSPFGGQPEEESEDVQITNDDIEGVAEEVAESLPDDASEEDIDKAVDDLMKDDGGGK